MTHHIGSTSEAYHYDNHDHGSNYNNNDYGGISNNSDNDCNINISIRSHGTNQRKQCSALNVNNSNTNINTNAYTYNVNQQPLIYSQQTSMQEIQAKEFILKWFSLSRQERRMYQWEVPTTATSTHAVTPKTIKYPNLANILTNVNANLHINSSKTALNPSSTAVNKTKLIINSPNSSPTKPKLLPSTPSNLSCATTQINTKNIVLYKLMMPLIYSDIDLKHIVISQSDMSDKFNRFFTSSFKIKTVYASSCSLHSKNPSSHRNSITRNEYLATNVCSCTASPSMNSTNGNLSSTGEDNIFNLADYFLFNLDKNIQIYEVSKKWHHSSNFMKDIDVAVQQSPHKDRDKNRKFTPVHSSTPQPNKIYTISPWSKVEVSRLQSMTGFNSNSSSIKVCFPRVCNNSSNMGKSNLNIADHVNQSMITQIKNSTSIEVTNNIQGNQSLLVQDETKKYRQQQKTQTNSNQPNNSQLKSIRFLYADKSLINRFRSEILKQDYQLKTNFIINNFLCGVTPAYNNLSAITGVERCRKGSVLKGVQERVYVVYEGLVMEEVTIKNNQRSTNNNANSNCKANFNKRKTCRNNYKQPHRQQQSKGNRYSLDAEYEHLLSLSQNKNEAKNMCIGEKWKFQLGKGLFICKKSLRSYINSYMGTTVGKENGGAMGSCNMNGNVNICNALSNSNTFSLTNPISINMNNPTTLTNLHLNQNQPHSTHQHHRQYIHSYTCMTDCILLVIQYSDLYKILKNEKKAKNRILQKIQEIQATHLDIIQKTLKFQQSLVQSQNRPIQLRAFVMSKTKDEENCDGIIGADNNNFDEQTLQNYTNTNFKRQINKKSVQIIKTTPSLTPTKLTPKIQTPTHKNNNTNMKNLLIFDNLNSNKISESINSNRIQNCNKKGAAHLRKRTQILQNEYQQFITLDKYEIMTRNKQNVSKKHLIYAQLNNLLKEKQKEQRFIKKMNTEKGMKQIKKCQYQARLKQNKIQHLAIKDSIMNAEKFRDKPHEIRFIFEQEIIDKLLKSNQNQSNHYNHTNTHHSNSNNSNHYNYNSQTEKQLKFQRKRKKQISMVGLQEQFFKDQKVYGGNKLQFLKMGKKIKFQNDILQFQSRKKFKHCQSTPNLEYVPTSKNVINISSTANITNVQEKQYYA